MNEGAGVMRSEVVEGIFVASLYYCTFVLIIRCCYLWPPVA